MDSKKKFNKNRYWKSKYQPRNASTSTTLKKRVHKKDDDCDQSEESEEEFVLKQRLPENGWFPNYDSSSSSSDLEFLTKVSSCASTSDFKKNITKETKCDENWFDKELDSVEFNHCIPETKQCKSIAKNETKLKLFPSNNTIYECKSSKYKSKNNVIQKSLEEAKKDTHTEIPDKEEDDLDFLLSLTEPVHTGPLILKSNLENERRLFVTNTANDKPVKSIDLEKWLDSVLDD